VQGDGVFRRYVVKLSECPNYAGPIVQLRLDPVSKGKADDFVRVKSIRLVKTVP
jgi:hypothetical protein